MTKLMMIAGVALMTLAPPAPAVAAVDGVTASAKKHTMRTAKKKRPVIKRSSAKYPGGRCGKLNLERARLYGLCR